MQNAIDVCMYCQEMRHEASIFNIQSVLNAEPILFETLVSVLGHAATDINLANLSSGYSSIVKSHGAC